METATIWDIIKETVTQLVTIMGTISTALLENEIFGIVMGVVIFGIVMGVIFALVRKLRRKGK